MTDAEENLPALRRVVEAEVAAADANRPDLGDPSSWLVDPVEAEWAATALHSLLGAIQAIGDDPRLALRPGDPA